MAHRIARRERVAAEGGEQDRHGEEDEEHEPRFGRDRGGVPERDRTGHGDRDDPRDRRRPSRSTGDDVGERRGQQGCGGDADAGDVGAEQLRDECAHAVRERERGRRGERDACRERVGRAHPPEAGEGEQDRRNPSLIARGRVDQCDDERGHGREQRRHDERDAVRRIAEAHERPASEQQRATARDPHPRGVPRRRETCVGCREPWRDREECAHRERRCECDMCRADGARARG